MPLNNILPMLGSILGSGVVAAFASHLMASRLESKRTSASARYWAIRTAIELERFALDCAHTVSDHRDFRESRGSMGEPASALPTLTPFAEGTDWKSLAQELVAQALQLPLEINNAKNSIAFMSRVAGADDVEDECCDQAAINGNRALDLAKRFRKRYELPALRLENAKWEFSESLQEHVALLEGRKARASANRLPTVDVS
jgi:hypothetical protein